MTADFVAARGLPTRERLAERPHGTRLRYISGCHCMLCRAANSRYECGRAAARRAGDWNGLVDAGPARAHVLALGRRGVGYKAVAAAASVSISVMSKIRSGQRRRIRAMAARRILSVDLEARADGARVRAASSWRLIALLLEEGYTKARLARELGAQRPALQLGRRRVLASTALRVERLYRRLTA